jgi:hypothetical protein
MSNNLIPLGIARTYDPTMRINNTREFSILHGAELVNYELFTPQAISNSQVNINCNPPSSQHVVDRLFFNRFTYQLNFTGTAVPGERLLQLGTNDGPRAYPTAMVTNTLTCTINNASMNTTLNQYWSAAQRINNFVDQENLDFSITPSMSDQYLEYNDWTVYGSNRNPLGFYGENAHQEPRGAFQFDSVTNEAGAASAQVIMTVTEPMFLSPLKYARDDFESGLIGVRTMNFNWSLGDLRRVWSHSSGGKTLSLSVTILNAGVLAKFLTPKIVEPIPPAISWPYYEIDVNANNTGGVLNAGSSRDFTLNSTDINYIPNRIIIFARERDQDLTYQSTDTFARINSITITFGNRPGLLSTMTPQQLHKMSVRNGLNSSYSQFRQFVGSILVVDPALDMGLNSLQAPGLIDKTQLRITANYTNQYARNIEFTFYIIVVNEGTFSIINGSSIKQLGVITQQDILNSSNAPIVPYVKSDNFYGGNFLSSLKNFFSKAKEGYNKARPYLTAIADVAKGTPLAAYTEPARQLLGVGMRKKGRGLVGGRMVELKDLKRNIKRYHDEEEDEDDDF